MADFVPVAPFAALEDNAARAVTVAGIAVLLCRSGDDCFAIENLCTHAEQPLDCGRIRNGWIACPAHGARFDLATGEPWGPPATVALRTYPVRITDGMVEVAVDLP
jgi:nitrite reductase/ring-hydroxylating ferredoxin subunit